MNFRFFEPRDQPSVDALHIQLQARMGQKFDLPPLDQRPIIASLVREKDGVITHVAALEAEAEIVLLGESPLSLKEWDDAATILTEVCCAYRIRLVRAFVPAAALQSKTKRGSPIERILKRFGFVREDQSQLTTFSRWMA